MTDSLRTANLLGAAVVALFDEIRAAVESQAGRSGEGPAALVVLGHQPGLSNDRLSRLLGLTHTGAVRLVDRLVADGLVERRPPATGRRGVALHLTPAGDAARRDILSARAAAILPVVERLAPRHQAALAGLLGQLLQGVAGDDTHKLRICRLCNGDVCTDCPIYVPVGAGTADTTAAPSRVSASRTAPVRDRGRHG